MSRRSNPPALTAFRRAAIAGALGVVLLGACSSNRTSSATEPPATTDAATTTVESTTTTTDAATTTVAPTTIAVTAPPPTPTTVPIPTAPDAYATAFVRAWERGAQTAAAVLGTPDAVASAFTQDGGGAGTWSLEGCEGAAGSSYCTFGAGGTPKVIVRVGNEAASLGQPHAVTEVQFQG